MRPSQLAAQLVGVTRQRPTSTVMEARLPLTTGAVSICQNSLAAGVADHLEGCNAEITVLLFAGCLLNVPFFLFFILFCSCFAGRRACDRHLVANMLIKLNATAP